MTAMRGPMLRRPHIPWFAAALVVFGCGGEAEQSAGSETNDDGTSAAPSGGKLDSTVPDRDDLDKLDTLGWDGYAPIAEASGLAVRRGVDLDEILVIGDHDRVLAVAPFFETPDPGWLSFVRHDVAWLFPEGEGTAAQWEAVTVDAAGNVFVLEEQPGAVYVLSPALDARLHTIHLEVPGGGGWRDDLAEDWADEPNSRGEGLVLGETGHLLVLKEKKPSLLVEFGPPWDEPVGYRASARPFGEATDFPLPEGQESTYVPLAVWEFKSKVRELMPDMSELAVGPEGSLYIVSGEARVLARIEGDLGVHDDAKISIDLAWKIPKRAVNPEGLVSIRPFEFLVASDQADGDNLFYLSAEP